MVRKRGKREGGAKKGDEVHDASEYPFGILHQLSQLDVYNQQLWYAALHQQYCLAEAVGMSGSGSGSATPRLESSSPVGASNSEGDGEAAYTHLVGGADQSNLRFLLQYYLAYTGADETNSVADGANEQQIKAWKEWQLLYAQQQALVGHAVVGSGGEATLLPRGPFDVESTREWDRPRQARMNRETLEQLDSRTQEALRPLHHQTVVTAEDVHSILMESQQPWIARSDPSPYVEETPPQESFSEQLSMPSEPNSHQGNLLLQRSELARMQEEIQAVQQGIRALQLQSQQPENYVAAQQSVQGVCPISRDASELLQCFDDMLERRHGVKRSDVKEKHHQSFKPKPIGRLVLRAPEPRGSVSTSLSRGNASIARGDSGVPRGSESTLISRRRASGVTGTSSSIRVLPARMAASAAPGSAAELGAAKATALAAAMAAQREAEEEAQRQAEAESERQANAQAERQARIEAVQQAETEGEQQVEIETASQENLQNPISAPGRTIGAFVARCMPGWAAAHAEDRAEVASEDFASLRSEYTKLSAQDHLDGSSVVSPRQDTRDSGCDPKMSVVRLPAQTPLSKPRPVVRPLQLCGQPTFMTPPLAAPQRGVLGKTRYVGAFGVLPVGARRPRPSAAPAQREMASSNTAEEGGATTPFNSQVADPDTLSTCIPSSTIGSFEAVGVTSSLAMGGVWGSPTPTCGAYVAEAYNTAHSDSSVDANPDDEDCTNSNAAEKAAVEAVAAVAARMRFRPTPLPKPPPPRLSILARTTEKQGERSRVPREPSHPPPKHLLRRLASLRAIEYRDRVAQSCIAETPLWKVVAESTLPASEECGSVTSSNVEPSAQPQSLVDPLSCGDSEALLSAPKQRVTRQPAWSHAYRSSVGVLGYGSGEVDNEADSWRVQRWSELIDSHAEGDELEINDDCYSKADNPSVRETGTDDISNYEHLEGSWTRKKNRKGWRRRQSSARVGPPPRVPPQHLQHLHPSRHQASSSAKPGGPRTVVLSADSAAFVTSAVVGEHETTSTTTVQPSSAAIAISIGCLECPRLRGSMGRFFQSEASKRRAAQVAAEEEKEVQNAAKRLEERLLGMEEARKPKVTWRQRLAAVGSTTAGGSIRVATPRVPDEEVEKVVTPACSPIPVLPKPPLLQKEGGDEVTLGFHHWPDEVKPRTAIRPLSEWDAIKPPAALDLTISDEGLAPADDADSSKVSEAGVFLRVFDGMEESQKLDARHAFIVIGSTLRVAHIADGTHLSVKAQHASLTFRPPGDFLVQSLNGDVCLSSPSSHIAVTAALSRERRAAPKRPMFPAMLSVGSAPQKLTRQRCCFQMGRSELVFFVDVLPSAENVRALGTARHLLDAFIDGRISGRPKREPQQRVEEPVPKVPVTDLYDPSRIADKTQKRSARSEQRRRHVSPSRTPPRCRRRSPSRSPRPRRSGTSGSRSVASLFAFGTTPRPDVGFHGSGRRPRSVSPSVWRHDRVQLPKSVSRSPNRRQRATSSSSPPRRPQSSFCSDRSPIRRLNPPRECRDSKESIKLKRSTNRKRRLSSSLPTPSHRSTSSLPASSRESPRGSAKKSKSSLLMEASDEKSNDSTQEHDARCCHSASSSVPRVRIRKRKPTRHHVKAEDARRQDRTRESKERKRDLDVSEQEHVQDKSRRKGDFGDEDKNIAMHREKRFKKSNIQEPNAEHRSLHTEPFMQDERREKKQRKHRGGRDVRESSISVVAVVKNKGKQLNVTEPSRDSEETEPEVLSEVSSIRGRRRHKSADSALDEVEGTMQRTNESECKGTKKREAVATTPDKESKGATQDEKARCKRRSDKKCKKHKRKSKDIESVDTTDRRAALEAGANEDRSDEEKPIVRKTAREKKRKKMKKAKENDEGYDEDRSAALEAGANEDASAEERGIVRKTARERKRKKMKRAKEKDEEYDEEQNCRQQTEDAESEVEFIKASPTPHLACPVEAPNDALLPEDSEDEQRPFRLLPELSISDGDGSAKEASEERQRKDDDDEEEEQEESEKVEHDEEKVAEQKADDLEVQKGGVAKEKSEDDAEAFVAAQLEALQRRRPNTTHLEGSVLQARSSVRFSISRKIVLLDD